MKKIIELAEKALALETFVDSREEVLALDELETAIDEYKQLEQTPVTEEWLKEHRFHISNELHSKRDKIYIKEDVKVYLDVDVETGIIGNADCIEINDVSISFHKDTYGNRGSITLADLYDACELCGIEL